MIGGPDSAAALRIVEQVAAVGVIVSCLEWLAQPAKLRDDALLGWATQRNRAAWLVRARYGRLLDALFAFSGAIALHVLRLACAVTLVAPWTDGPLRVACVLTLAGLALALRFRLPIGLDGSDQMLSIVLVTVALAHVVDSETGRVLCLAFLACQACLAYATSGWLKLADPLWRDGTYLGRVLSSTTFGHPRLGAFLLRNRRAARLLTAAMLGFECLFFAGVLLGGPAAVVAIACGVAFHLATAVFMGLNTFVWAFVATYPAVWFVAV